MTFCLPSFTYLCMEEIKERDTAIDVAKGIGIIFVVSGHCGLSVFGIDPYAFHMPFFFFISGYLYAEKSNSVYLLSKVKSLLLPLYAYIFAYSIVYYVAVSSGLYPGSYPNWFRSVILDPFLGAHNIPFTLTLWFVSCLFLASLLFQLFFKASKGNPYLAFVLGTLGILALIHVPSDNKYAFVARTLIAFAWICLGYSFRKAVKRLSTFQWLALALGVFAISCIFASTMHFEMVWNRYSATLLSPLAFGISGSILLVAFSRGIKGPLQSFLASLGKESFHIMANHLFVFFLLNMMFVAFSGDSSWFKGIYSFPSAQSRFVFLIVGLLLPWFVALHLRRFRQ